ncbi:MAG: translocation/assembly module TamB domain-containing protein, partial [FCB group bacterium]|nr:translocation/assembly module TamB domain-containing protein [FCB group bacterium]
MIIAIGSTGVFFTKTDVGFTILYRILQDQLSRRFDYTISIKDLNKDLKTTLRANIMEFANEDSSLVFSIDTLNIQYTGIFEMLGKRRLESLQLIEPRIHIRVKDRQRDLQDISDFSFPDIHINRIYIRNAHLYIQMPDTLIYQTVENAEFAYSGRQDGAVISVHDLNVKNEAHQIHVHALCSEVVFRNDIAKLKNLRFKLNDTQVSSEGKVRYIEPFRFQFTFNLEDIPVDTYFDQYFIKDDDMINLRLNLMGDFNAFTATADFTGSINRKKIQFANISIEYKNDYIHLLQAVFKAPDTDISLYGSYGIKDKYLTTTFFSHSLQPEEWFESFPECTFQGRMRANGFMDATLRVNYDLSFDRLLGMGKTALKGNVLVQEMNDIVLDTSNYIYLPDGLLKVRGSIHDRERINLDIFGDIRSFNDLRLPGMAPFKTDNIMLTMKLLGRLTDPDIQINFNLDTLIYEPYSIQNMNVSLFSNQIMSNPGGGVLISFENGYIDSLETGSVETYIHVDKDLITVDYFDIEHENYVMSLSGSVKDLKDFSIKTMRGKYLNQDVYLLSPASFTVRDNGFSLSRFDILYREALLYGSLDVDSDSIWGSINLAGADLSTLPFLSTMGEGVKGLLNINADISGYLDDPEINASLLLRRAHAFGLDAERIQAGMYYKNNNFQVAQLNVNFAPGRSMRLNVDLPLNINFKQKDIIRVLQENPVRAEYHLTQARLSKIAPFLVEDFQVSGDVNLHGNIYGTLNDPLMDADLLVLNPVIDKILADSMAVKIRYQQEHLYFNEGHIAANNGHYRGNGFFYLDMRYDAPGQRFSPDSTVYAFLQGNDDELIYLTPYIEDIEQLKGNLYTELEIRGSFNETIKNGRIDISNGRMVLGMLRNEIENLDGSLIMKNNIADVRLRAKLPSVSYTLAGVLGLRSMGAAEKYNFSIGGKMDMTNLLEPVFDLSITGDQVSIVTLDENFNLTTGAVDLSVTGKDTLSITGDLTITEGMIEMDFTRPAPIADNVRDNKISTAFTINALIDKIFFRNQFIDATLDGEATLLKYPSESGVRLGGELNVRQGFFNYWASVFELEEGGIVFDQFENNHQLNFVAFKRISGGNRIIASISGELNNPEIDFIDENNQMTKAEIIRELTIGEIENTFSSINRSSS